MLFFTKAFMCLSDVLIAHNYQLQMWDSSAGTPLLYTPDPKLQKALLSFVLEHVFTSPELDTHSSKGSLPFSFTVNHRVLVWPVLCCGLTRGRPQQIQRCLLDPILRFLWKYAQNRKLSCCWNSMTYSMWGLLTGWFKMNTYQVLNTSKNHLQSHWNGEIASQLAINFMSYSIWLVWSSNQTSFKENIWCLFF